MTVSGLVAETNVFSVKNRPGCKAVLVESKPKHLYTKYRVFGAEKSSDPNGHEVTVRFNATKLLQTQQASDLDVKVNCSCQAFLYWSGQWNAFEREALLPPVRPLLQPPTERLDLRGHFVICKHCLVVLERVLPSVQFNIDNLLRKAEVARKLSQLTTPTALVAKQQAMRKRNGL